MAEWGAPFEQPVLSPGWGTGPCPQDVCSQHTYIKGLKAPSCHSDINFPVCTTEVSRSPGASVAGIFLPKSGTQARPIIAQGDGRTQAPYPHRDPHKPCRCPSPLQKSPPELPRMLGHPSTDNTQALRMPGKQNLQFSQTSEPIISGPTEPRASTQHRALRQPCL